MGKSLNEIAQEIKNNKEKVQLIYAFNGTGKTRLSKEFKSIIELKSDIEAEEISETSLTGRKILYYNAFTEDLFYWDNDLLNDTEPKLKIQPNDFTHWVFVDQGQDSNIIKNFQHYTDEKLNPKFNPNFSEVIFSYERGNDGNSDSIKISKGEESCFIWSVFYALFEQAIEVLSIYKDNIYQERKTNNFDNLEYVFIDDPVTSLDENHLIELAVDLSELIKKNKSNLKFIITTHNPLFYNVLSNEFNNKNKESGYNPNKHFKKQFLIKTKNLTYELNSSNDSPFSYHLFLLNEIKIAIETEQIYKYHFNFLRNILEKTSTFLGYDSWDELLSPIIGNKESYTKRILNLSSHSRHSAEEIVMITDEDKRVLIKLVKEILTIYKFNSKQNTLIKEDLTMCDYNPIAESNNFIVLEKYEKIEQQDASYQTEADLEREFIKDLVNQGYEYLPHLTTPKAMLENVRVQLQILNNMKFNDEEWTRFCDEYLNKANDNHIDKMRKIHNDYIYDFVFDDGHIQNIYLVDKNNITKNKTQVISQFSQKGTQANRYDVTILINGLPLIQVELKKRGIAIKEAFNQVNRYSKESFNSDNSLFKYIQICVISNGTDSRYFANSTKRNKSSFDFTMNWANAKNAVIKDLKDFTATFFQKITLLKVLLHYSVFDIGNNLLIMRPYQIAATERILWKIKSSYEAKKWKTTESGGYIWHTTGSGKTLTSFKAARLATELDFINKVFFVVDRKDLDYQTMKEYQRFSPDSVNGSENTAGLKRNIEKEDNKIIVTTIQKLNNLIKSEPNLPIYNKQVVFIFDEAHRSQFGEAQKNINKKFKKYYKFGFTGTPIFPENALGAEITASVFGCELHSYVITDAIRDEKVLKFKVDYNNVRPKFKSIEMEQDEEKLSAFETKEALLHPERIKEISSYILDNFKIKTHRSHISGKGFNAMFAVSDIRAAKLYYESLKKLQKNSDKPLKIATIFSFVDNEEQSSVGEIPDETFEPSAMDSSSKEFLALVIKDYNTTFKTNYGVDTKEFQNYYRDLANRVKKQEIDLLIVVGMFLTGFDAPTLNTLFVDKNLRYHGLMQAYSRTNRIYDSTKTFGNIVTFRNLEDATIAAIKCFGDDNTKNIVLEKSYAEYMEGFTDIATGEARRGYIDVVKELHSRFPNIDNIVTTSDKKEFSKLFGEYLRIENVLQNYDEFTRLKALHSIDMQDLKATEEFKSTHNINDEDIATMKNIKMPEERIIQDYRSTYNDIREWIRRGWEGKDKEKSSIDWDDVVFEVELLKSQEINLDYILELIFEKNKKVKDKTVLIDEVRRLIRSSIGNRAKESLVVDFIGRTDLDKIQDKASIIDAFFSFAQIEQTREANKLINEEKLNVDAAKRYILASLKRDFASENGTELNEILPKMSPLNPNYLTKKQSVFQKISAFVEKFKGVGGTI